MTVNKIDYATQIKNIPGALTEIAALTPANDDIIQRKAGAWVKRTIAQYAADLASILAPLASPALTGNPTAPTPAVSDNDTSIATTAFVMAQRGDIPGGATLPASPLANQLFMHTPTGRRVLMLYTNSVWYPLYSFGSMTVYVNYTSGADSADKGTGTGANAYKTLSYAWTQLPSIYYGNIVINVSGETYNEQLTCQGKKPGGSFTVTLNGTNSTIISGTVTSAVQGTGATLGSVTDASQTLTVNAHVGQWISTNQGKRVIVSNTVDTYTIVGTFSGVPSGAYTIQDNTTVIDGQSARSYGIYTINQDLIIVNIKVIGCTSQPIYVSSKSDVIVRYVRTVSNTNTHGIRTSESIILVENSHISQSGSGRGIFIDSHSTGTAYRNLVIQTGAKSGYGISVANESIGSFGIVNIVDNFSYGIMANSASQAGYYEAASNGYNIVRNCSIGLLAQTGGQQAGTTNIQYSGNATNESASAATFAYID